MKCSNCGHEWYTEKEYGSFDCPACGHGFILAGASNANGGRNIVDRFQISGNIYVTFTYNMRKYIQIRVPFERMTLEKKAQFTDYIKSQANSFEKLYSVGFRMYDNIISDTLENTGLDILIKNEIDWYSIDMLKRGLSDFTDGGEADQFLQKFFSYRQELDMIID